MGNTKKVNKIVGENIFTLRRKMGWLQIDLALKVGLSRTTVTNIEQGRHPLTIETLYKFMKAFNCSYSKLLPTHKQLEGYGK